MTFLFITAQIVRERARQMIEFADRYEHDMMEINQLMNAEEQRHAQAMQAFRQRRNQLTADFANMQLNDEEE